VTQHTLSVLVENKPGVLSRVAGMFTRRGYNIDSLAVSPTEDEHRSRMTITVDASRFPVEQITKQLDKLINVIKVRDLDPDNMVARELGLFKVSTAEAPRAEVLALVDIFKGEIVDVTSESMIIHDHPGHRHDSGAREPRGTAPWQRAGRDGPHRRRGPGPRR